MSADTALGRALASLSLANLMFLRLWLKMLPYHRGTGYLLGGSPRNSYLALMLNVLLWGALFYLLLSWGRRLRRGYPWLVLGVHAVVWFTALYGAGNSLMSLARFAFLFGAGAVPYLEAGLCLAGVAGLLLAVRLREPLARLCTVLPLFFAPFLLLTFGQAAAALSQMEPASQFEPHRVDPAAPLQNRAGIPVVWMIFDETDYRLGFAERPAGVSLPAFDRFQSQALFATRAYSPSDVTRCSLPALLTGIPLKGTEPAGARELDLIRSDTGARLDFSGQQTIFDRVKERQGSTALFGWYHPYSRVLHGVDLARDYTMYTFFTSKQLPKLVLLQNWELWDLRFLPINDTVIGHNHLQILRQMQSDVLGCLGGSEPSFMFLHYPVPHAPNIYERRSGRFGFNRDRREGYFDNLALADRCLAEVRAEMERRGTWDRALVVISSDHHWRTNTYDGKIDYQHVPFLVKLPHQKKELRYDGKFNTVLTQQLILDVLDGKLHSPEEAAAWLERAARQRGLPAVPGPVQPDDD